MKLKDLKRIIVTTTVLAATIVTTAFADTGWKPLMMSNGTESWFYFFNNIPLKNQLTPDNEYVGADGTKVENNIDHDKYAEESQGTKILVYSKTAHKVELWSNGELEAAYPATSGKASGDKEFEGDCKTPVGTFYICQKLPNSAYTKGLLISYPAVEDAERGLASGIIGYGEYQQIVAANAVGGVPSQYTKLGGEIEFHGNGQVMDATRGCIGLKDADIIDLFNRVPQGCRVDIIE